MVFREAFLQNQRNSEHEWTIDSEGNISGGDLLNREFVAKKYEQLRRLLQQQGIQAAETRVFSNPWGMQRAAVHIPAIICDGYDIRELSDALSIHTGMRVGIIRVKFCNQCSRAMMASGNDNVCPRCARHDELTN